MNSPTFLEVISVNTSTPWQEGFVEQNELSLEVKD